MGSHVVRISALLLELVNMGCKNGILWVARLEQGIKLAHFSRGVVVSGSDAKIWCHHIRVATTMLRDFKKEGLGDRLTSPYNIRERQGNVSG